MLLSEVFFNKLCPTYRKAVLKFELEYSDLFEYGQDAKKKLLKDFSCHYLTPKEYWNEWFNLIGEVTNYQISEEVIEVSDLAGHHFYYYEGHIRHLSKKNLTRKYNNGMTNTVVKAEDLIFPQARLDEDFRSYEEECSSPPTKEIIEIIKKMKELYNEIMSTTDDYCNWFKLITKVDDEEFVEINVENRLANDLTNKNLWKLYINYWKEKSDKRKMLQVYSKYCRFFIDDEEMKQEYKKEAELYGFKVVVGFKNCFEFERFKIFESHEFSMRKIKKVEFDNGRKCAEISLDNIQLQSFPFPKTIMNYIFENQNSNVRHKFHKSCKYLFALNPSPVCYKLVYDKDKQFGTQFVEQSLIIFAKEENNYTVIPNRKLCLSTTLSFNDPRTNFLSLTLTNIYKCEAKYLNITNQNITEKEFDFLVKSGNVESLSLRRVNIYISTNEILPLEGILSKIPKLVTAVIHNAKTTSQTAQILSEIPFKNKILHIILGTMGLLEPYKLSEFITRNFTQNGYFYQRTKPVENEDDVTKCHEVVRKCVKEFWQNQSHRPYVKITF